MPGFVMFDCSPSVEQFQGCCECQHGRATGGNSTCGGCVRHYRHESRLKEYKDNFVKFSPKVKVRTDDDD